MGSGLPVEYWASGLSARWQPYLRLVNAPRIVWESPEHPLLGLIYINPSFAGLFTGLSRQNWDCWQVCGIQGFMEVILHNRSISVILKESHNGSLTSLYVTRLMEDTFCLMQVTQPDGSYQASNKSTASQNSLFFFCIILKRMCT